MNDAVAFQTRARTIDHLGREQIADVPTAVSELWKNAYDAYAHEVSLHIHSTELPVAVITDDGHGMSRKQFLDKWLVVGTESKAGNDSVPQALRKGLEERPKQGQKGIGRLSVAALGATALIVSKQAQEKFVACLIDWRLFENPYVLLHDVKLPVIEFSDVAELALHVPQMRSSLLENLTGSAGDDGRASRLSSAWAEFDRLIKERDETEQAVSDQIISSANRELELDTFLNSWSVWTGADESGTAIIITELNSALLAWTAEGDETKLDEVEAIKASMIRTLSGFSDPYVKNDEALNYSVVVHARSGSKVVVGREEGFGIEYLESLDHSLIGEMDEYGVFRGRVKVFGKDIGNIEIAPSHPIPTSNKEKVGPFLLCLGAYEPIARSSSLSEAVHAKVADRAETHSGLNVYRDGLRVMPYGRPESDFFKIEERRQFHAGREFWASRRIFGRIAISRSNNPNLRDKAGREGLIDNGASRAIQALVVDLLKVTARRYFGTDAPIRKELLPGVEAENDAAAKNAKQARSGQLTNFRNSVKTQFSELQIALSKAQSTALQLDSVLEGKSLDELWKLSTEVNNLQDFRSELRLPPKPKVLGKFEERYREYRDQYSILVEIIEDVRQRWASETERLKAKPAIDVVKSRLASHQSALSDQLSRWRKVITDILSSEQARIINSIQDDQKEYYKKVSPLLFEVESQRVVLTVALSELDEARQNLNEQFSSRYESYKRSLQQLASGVDLDGAFAYAGARTETLEGRLEKIQSLAQVGVSVEILSHELHVLDRRLQTSLDKLPSEVKRTKEFSEANWARQELVERLRFLSQLQISGSDVRQKITGSDIDEYLTAFFGNALAEKEAVIKSSEVFKKAAFYEFPSRIFPVFINLINNSLYWLPATGEKVIQIDVVEGAIVICDSGPGIDSDDIESLFELFFTRRIRGRGVGLYLCRQTLAAGGHTITYTDAKPWKLLSGACFVINLRNGFDA
ncbi:signal transduction histidine kinase [Pseudomonas chlororaphis]|uniref:ATP-binding protein n=1 Tax=Pseudomonas chlororaphis TaxID=587753 RepID=UPI0020A0145B|nr:ATP-binding protein [Pseudomonas chlororaphis]MCP1482362.1 signal transduction histidine kinase [Pseudomonas chlororaphis]MCP1597280.1 signal transduction histidine kinase [Pseudomonas chlororaphis]